MTFEKIKFRSTLRNQHIFEMVLPQFRSPENFGHLIDIATCVENTLFNVGPRGFDLIRNTHRDTTIYMVNFH